MALSDQEISYIRVTLLLSLSHIFVLLYSSSLSTFKTLLPFLSLAKYLAQLIILYYPYILYDFFYHL